MIRFTRNDLGRLWKPKNNSHKGENGQVTIIGGSKLFHGAPMFAVRAASRIVDMVYFSSPDPDLEKISAKAMLGAFIWVPWEEIEYYVEKSDAVLIGPGMMRYESETSSFKKPDYQFDHDGTLTRSVTKYFLQKFSEKQWVIDGGSLQVIEKEWIPQRAILTTNEKEFELLFGSPFSLSDFQLTAKRQNCVIVFKGEITYVTDGEEIYEVAGGNAGLTKGGTGDVQAGLTVSFMAKNPPLLAAAAAAFVVKMTADKLYEKAGFNYNADDVSENVCVFMKEE